MTLAQERAATASSLRASRASTFKSDLNSLESSRRKVQQLNTLERKGARPVTRGRGVWNEATRTAVGEGGIASPLTEPSFAAREWWEEGWMFSDGLFSMPMLKKITFLDAEGKECVWLPANPNPPVAP